MTDSAHTLVTPARFVRLSPGARIAGTPALRTPEQVGAEMALSLLPFGAMILDANRNIVFANDTLAGLVGTGIKPEDLLGRRNGDIMDCEHAFETPGGCGTTESCQTCGAFVALGAALKGGSDCQECRISTTKPGAPRELRVWTRPMSFGGRAYVCAIVTDISTEKRRDALERTFFHDMLNTAGALNGLAVLLPDAEPEDAATMTASVARLSGVMVEELKAQRDLVAMEKGELVIDQHEQSTGDLVMSTVASWSEHRHAQGKSIEVHDEAEDVTFTSDRTLVGRVLSNMVKNALEATPAGGTVTVDARQVGDRVRLSVHNPSEMPRSVQAGVFQRSFSTKGRGRGIGTYSMKMLSQRYLGGRVWFETAPGLGTTFFAEYPIAGVRMSTETEILLAKTA